MKLNCKQCGRCCGTVPMTIRMFRRFKDRTTKKYRLEDFGPGYVVAITDDDQCVFLDNDNLCLIYNNRPLVCRIYGVNEKLPCVNAHPVRAEEEARISFKNIRDAVICK